MSVPAWVEVQLAVGGALRLARGDRRGLGFFDTSIDGFWRSFRAAAICYPLYLLLLSFRVAAAQWEASGIATILVIETISYVISWVAFPLLMLPLALTSTAGMIRRLGGRRWQLLHRLIYLSALAGVIHYYWLVKADVTLPLRYAAIVAVLLACRLLLYFADRRSPAPPAPAHAERVAP